LLLLLLLVLVPLQLLLLLLYIWQALQLHIWHVCQCTEQCVAHCNHLLNRVTC
jgi:hypothetical protein